MNKLMIKAMVKAEEAKLTIKDRVCNKKGATTLEWVGIALLVIGMIVVAKPLVTTILTKVISATDTSITGKITEIGK